MVSVNDMTMNNDNDNDNDNDNENENENDGCKQACAHRRTDNGLHTAHVHNELKKVYIFSQVLA